MILALLLALAAPILPALPEPAPATALDHSADQLFRQGRDLRYAQRWYEAVQTYRTLLREFPASSRAADARYWLASSLEQDQRWDDAAEAYTEFLASPTATAGLASALGDEREEVRIAAALQLAKRKDPRAQPVLQAGLSVDGSSEACRLALLAMGAQPQAAGPAQGRFLVVRVKERTKAEALTVRLALGLARAVGGYLSDEQLRLAQKKGVDLERLMDLALNAPKGTELFSLDDGKSTVTVTVE